MLRRDSVVWMEPRETLDPLAPRYVSSIFKMSVICFH